MQQNEGERMTAQIMCNMLQLTCWFECLAANLLRAAFELAAAVVLVPLFPGDDRAAVVLPVDCPDALLPRDEEYVTACDAR
jgi:hypothetical protein